MNKTHDFSSRGWGHDYTFTPIDKGKKGRIMGWCRGINKSDYLILRNGDRTSRYQVDSVKYFSDPTDMFSANVSHAPDPAGSKPVPREEDIKEDWSENIAKLELINQ